MLRSPTLHTLSSACSTSFFPAFCAGRRVLSKRMSSVTPHNPFPYPTNSKPTPYQIFHLPSSTSKIDIKQRYFELVRVYHPDSPYSRATKCAPEVARLRFHSITSAYATLLGKDHASVDDGAPDAQERARAHWKATKVRRYEFLDGHGADEHWKDRILLGAVILTGIVFVVQTMWTRRRALAQVVAEGRQRSDPAQVRPETASSAGDE